MVNAILSTIPPDKVGSVDFGCARGTVGPAGQFLNSYALGFSRK